MDTSTDYLTCTLSTQCQWFQKFLIYDFIAGYKNSRPGDSLKNSVSKHFRVSSVLLAAKFEYEIQTYFPVCGVFDDFALSLPGLSSKIKRWECASRHFPVCVSISKTAHSIFAGPPPEEYRWGGSPRQRPILCAISTPKTERTDPVIPKSLI